VVIKATFTYQKVSKHHLYLSQKKTRHRRTPKHLNKTHTEVINNMDHFNYKNNTLFAEELAIDNIAHQYGTPCYIYSKATLERHWHAFDQAFGEQDHLICYAVKACQHTYRVEDVRRRT